MTNGDPAGLGFSKCIKVSSCVCNAFFTASTRTALCCDRPRRNMCRTRRDDCDIASAIPRCQRWRFI